MKEKQAPEEFSRLAQELIGDLRGIPFSEPARMRRRPTKDLGPLMEAVLAKHHIGTENLAEDIRAHWAQVVGPANAQFSHPILLDDKQILHVSYSHSMVHSNLKLMKPTILERLRALPRCGSIKDIRLRLGGG